MRPRRAVRLNMDNGPLFITVLSADCQFERVALFDIQFLAFMPKVVCPDVFMLCKRVVMPIVAR